MPQYNQNDQFNRIRWAWQVVRVGEERNAYPVLMGKPEEKRPLRRPRRTWENNIKMDRNEIGRYCMMWTGFVWPRIGYSGGLCEHGIEGSGFIKC
jgi:hypothetical protein